VGGVRPQGSAHLKQSLPPSIHDLLRVCPPDECDTGRERDRDREERGREERGREEKGREERGREERGREERGHAEEKQEEERVRKIQYEKERDKIRSIERERDRELSRERADVVDYGLVARKKEKEKEQERLLIREAEREKSKEWEREKVKQARERLKKDAEEEERHQQLIQERIPQNPDPRAHRNGRIERGEGGNGDYQAAAGGGGGGAVGGGGAGDRDVKRGVGGMGREKEDGIRRDKERSETVDRKKGPGRADERGAARESRAPKEEVDEESLLVAELLALEKRQKTTLRIEDTQKRTDSGIQPPSSRDSDGNRKNQGRESQLPRGKTLARSESTPRPTRSEGVKEKVAFGPGARDVRKVDSKSAVVEVSGMMKSKSVTAVSGGSRSKEKEKDDERERERGKEMDKVREREKERERERVQATAKPVAQPDLVHLKAWTSAQEEVDNDEDFSSPVSRHSGASGTKGKMKKIMPDIRENQPAIEEGGGYLLEYRKKHADKEKEKGALGVGGGGGGGGGGGKVLRRRHSDMHQHGDMGREKEREEYGGESPNIIHVSSGTQSLGPKQDRRGVSKNRVAEEDSMSLPPILPASVTAEGTGRHPMDKKRNRSGGTASAPSRLRHEAASSLRAASGFEPEAPVLPNPIRVSHDYGSPNGHSPILQNNSRVGKKIPVR
jgi:hypothetical protein